MLLSSRPELAFGAAVDVAEVYFMIIPRFGPFCGRAMTMWLGLRRTRIPAAGRGPTQCGFGRK